MPAASANSAHMLAEPLTFAKIGIPASFLVEWRLLAETGKGDLRTSILDPIAPALPGIQSDRRDCLLQRCVDRAALSFSQFIGIDLPPAALILEKLASGSGQEKEPGQVSDIGQPSEQLLVELGPVPA